MIKLQNGKEIPALSVGTYLLKGVQLFTAVDEALANGYRSFDTAKYYQNEQELGEIFKQLLPQYNLETNEVFLTTKVFPSSSTTRREDITNAVEESLRFLNRTYLDLVLVHYPRPLNSGDKDPNNRNYRMDAWLALEALLAAGKIHSIGVSNYEVNHIQEMTAYRTIDPQVNQVEFHPHFQRSALRTYCENNNIRFQAFSPLGRGNPKLLTDKTLIRIASTHQTSVACVILAWIMKKEYGVVVKSANPGRIEDNYRALHLRLTDDELDKIDDLDLSTPLTEDAGWLVC